MSRNSFRGSSCALREERLSRLNQWSYRDRLTRPGDTFRDLSTTPGQVPIYLPNLNGVRVTGWQACSASTTLGIWLLPRKNHFSTSPEAHHSMQDGFVADVGDFGKYGLLRALCNLEGSSHDARLHLGVVWCAVRGETIGRLT